MADVAERSAAIRECGLEIVALRRQVQLYIDRERDLRGEVERSKEDNTQESEVGIPCSPCPPSPSPHDPAQTTALSCALYSRAVACCTYCAHVSLNVNVWLFRDVGRR